jgi:hypothetical protein
MDCYIVSTSNVPGNFLWGGVQNFYFIWWEIKIYYILLNR